LDYKLIKNFMDNEKDLLKQDLNKLEKKEEIEKFVEDAEILGHEDIAQLGREKIASLSKKAESVSETSASQDGQVEQLGGSKDVINERTKEVDRKIEEVKEDSVKKINEVQTENKDSMNNDSSVLEKSKQEKFESLKTKFEKYYENPKPTEYNLKEISDNLGKAFFAGKLPEIDNILNSLPKDVVESLKNGESTAYDSKNAFSAWQKAIGGRISQLTNDRTEYFDSKTGTKAGTIPKEAKSYLITVANAARFFPKETSETYIKEAVDVFTDEQKLDFATGGNQFISADGRLKNMPEELNVLRNLLEAGYKDEAKKLMVLNLKKYGGSKSYDYFGKAFELTRLGLFSEDEVKDMLDQAGLLEEPKEEKKNEGWG